MRLCVIFNPVARGDKARHFRAWLENEAKDCALKPTQKAGDARRLAAEAVAEDFEIVAAAGGDGTVNEVLNGLGDAPNGFAKTRLAVLPLGTINVFARELNLPTDIVAAWKVAQAGKEKFVDLPRVEFFAEGKKQQRYFAQLAGAGLDARAIELVSWSLKKKIGPLAYVVAGWKALSERKPQIQLLAGTEKITGELVLLGNGKLYGGDFALHPQANLSDGQLTAGVFPRVNFWTLLRCAPSLLLKKQLPETKVQRMVANKIELTSISPVAFELDGDNVGHLPATFFIEPKKLRAVVA